MTMTDIATRGPILAGRPYRPASLFCAIFVIMTGCGARADGHFLQRNSIREGAVLEGVMRVITSGTCTPVLFEFPALKSDE